jgi:hypothetical protein
MRMLERAVSGDRPPSVDRFASELPAAVIAAMAERLESLVARSLARHKPPKVEIPSEGPWRASVREHLMHYCPASLEMLDREALRAKAAPIEASIFPAPPLDPAHVHSPVFESIDAPGQLPCDPELSAAPTGWRPDPVSHEWLAREFSETLNEVNERIVRSGPSDPLVSLRRLLASVDNLPEGASREQLRQSEALIGAVLEQREREEAPGHPWERRPGLTSLDDLFEEASHPRVACEHEIGGRSL